MNVEQAERRLIAPIEAQISHWDHRSNNLTRRSEHYSALADALQARIDAAPPGSHRRQALQARQDALRFIARYWAEQADDALARADEWEFSLSEARRHVESAAETVADDLVVLEQAREALASCRTTHVAA